MNNTAYHAETTAFMVNSSDIALLAETDQGRNAVVVHNEAGVLYVGLGLSVSPVKYAYRLVGNCTLELSGYIGALCGIKESGATSVFITTLV